jgi:taurine dioxygenase
MPLEVTMLQISPLAGAFGAEVTGIDRPIELVDPRTTASLVAALADHHVLDIECPPLTEELYVRFGRTWGEPIDYFNTRDRDVVHPELIRITNAASTPAAQRDGAMHWHQDSSYEQPPAWVTMLYAVEAPTGSNETLFADLTAAWATLDASTRAQIGGLVVRHDPAGGDPRLLVTGEKRGDSSKASRRLPEVTHPLVVRHPSTGIAALYGVAGTAVGIVGMADDDAVELLGLLKRHALEPRFRQQATAASGHVLVWDNLAVMHSATATTYSDADGERRRLHRISTRAAGPLVAAG